MARIESLHALNSTSERLLRTAYDMTAAEAEPYIERIRTALQAGEAHAAGVFDDGDTLRGLAYWRWVDADQSFARIHALYTESDAPPVLGEMLADHILTTLQDMPMLQAIEARARGESPGVREALARHDLVLFERCQMARPLDQPPLPDITLPDGYRAVLWTDEHQPEAEQIAQAGQQDTIDDTAVPEASSDKLAEGLRKLRTGEYPGVDRWLDQASFVVMDGQERVAGYIAMVESNSACLVADVVVHPDHRRRGLPAG